MNENTHLGTDSSEMQPPPVSMSQVALEQPTSPTIAGILLLVAAVSSLGLTTSDPTNPSLIALGTALIGIIASMQSFDRNRNKSVFYSGFFSILTGLSALYTMLMISNAGFSQVFIFTLIRGGLSFILTLCALYCLRAR